MTLATVARLYKRLYHLAAESADSFEEPARLRMYQAPMAWGVPGCAFVRKVENFTNLLAFCAARMYNRFGKLNSRGAWKQAERKVCPSTRKPDLDNANVGKTEEFIFQAGDHQIGGFPLFLCRRKLHG